MATRKLDPDDGSQSTDKGEPTQTRVIRKAIESITTHNKIVTQLAIGFKKSKD